MKKLALFFVFALLLNVLAGCQGTMGAAGNGAQTPPPVETTQTPPASAESTAPPETTVPPETTDPEEPTLGENELPLDPG